MKFQHPHHKLKRYPVSMNERLYVIVLGPLIVFALLAAIAHFFPLVQHPQTSISWSTIFWATLATLLRLMVAYALAVALAIPLAIAATHNEKVEAILLPLFDILESIPILALFPVAIIFFVQFNSFNGAAIFILFVTMLWNIVFTVVGGLKLIPKDIAYAARVFGIRGVSYVRKVLLPASVPQLVTGSILAVAQGWNIIIVAEVLHTYLPGGTEAQDLFGIGSILVHAAADGENQIFLAAVFAMIFVIGVFNFFVWQRLLHYSQRFRFE